ncbi:MAG: gamma-glutamylcyclotransferase, partial [Dehalococcoides sp.]
SGLRKLDAHEEYPANSERIKVNVHNEDGSLLEAFTHTRRRSGDEAKPSAEYLTVIQQAYHEWGLV